MAIETLQIKDLRNIERAKLEPETHINIIIGENASGKSSLLEAIHLLFLSRSFRSAKAEVIIRNDQDKFQVVSKIKQANQSATLGIERNRKQTTIKYAGEKIASAAKLALIQPIVLLTPENHQLILGGPTKRRKLIDWLLFHVEHTYHNNWQTYYKVLKNRNALLRRKRPLSELITWDEKLIETANILDQQRRRVTDQFKATFQRQTSQYCGFPISLEYHNGWGEGDFREVIEKNRQKDFAAGYTRKGPHRSDLIIETKGQLAAQILSRGQTKLLATALEIAKISLLEQLVKKKAIILVDDLAAELDSERKEKIAAMLFSVETQQFITATEKALLPAELIKNSKMFHVEHGRFQEVL